MYKHYMYVACKTVKEHPNWAFQFAFDLEKVTCSDCLALAKDINKEEK